MKIKLDMLLVTILYIFSLFMWTLPIQNNPVPYGEVDASSHFMIADYMVKTDKVIYELPPYIDIRYWRDNFLVNSRLWYHPPYHMNFANIGILGGHRITSLFLFNAILSSSGVIILFFIVRRLFGQLPAFLASLFMAFSMRDILIYMWGQWPQQLSYLMTPIILFSFYKYISSFLEQKTNFTYLYISV